MHIFFPVFFFSCLENNVLSLQATIFSDYLLVFSLKNSHHIKNLHFFPYSHFYTIDYKDRSRGINYTGNYSESADPVYSSLSSAWTLTQKSEFTAEP